mmetsp:Transcript_110361/g.351818  ORF Transcript_110361/g.351818 Transcript_110361/m.351818 type:complete len:110 (-) Transcript_110361:1599-1928(-)
MPTVFRLGVERKAFSLSPTTRAATGLVALPLTTDGRRANLLTLLRRFLVDRRDERLMEPWALIVGDSGTAHLTSLSSKLLPNLFSKSFRARSSSVVTSVCAAFARPSFR